MTWRATIVALAGLLAVGCSAPLTSSASGPDGPRARCLAQPGRSESYSMDRPLLFLFCVESP